MYQPIDAGVTTKSLAENSSIPCEPFSHTTGDIETIAISPQQPLLSNRWDSIQQHSSEWRQSQQLRLTRASEAIAHRLKEVWQQIDVSQPHWQYLSLGALLLSLPTGVSLAALQAIASPPETHCNQPQQFQADLAQLQCLHQGLESGEVQAIIRALPQLQAWPSDSPVHSVAQRLLKDWSVVALSMADLEFEAGEWDSATRLARAIPTELALGNEAQRRLNLWQQVKQQGDKTYKLALEALEQQNWTAARGHAKTLASLSNDYWRQQGLQALPQKIDEALQAQRPQGSAAQVSAAPAGLHQSSRKSHALSKKSGSIRRSRKAMPVFMSVASLSISGPAPTRPEFSAI